VIAAFTRGSELASVEEIVANPQEDNRVIIFKDDRGRVVVCGLRLQLFGVRREAARRHYPD